jgi:hypothetical protein
VLELPVKLPIVIAVLTAEVPKLNVDPFDCNTTALPLVFKIFVIVAIKTPKRSGAHFQRSHDYIYTTDKLPVA